MTDYISFSICNKCNLDCPYCYKQKDGDIFQLKDIGRIRQLKNLGIKVINISGGEPYFHKDLHSIIEQLSIDFYLYLSSNGLLIDEEELDYINRNPKIRLLSVPLYGYEKYDRLLTNEDHFDKIIKIIEIHNRKNLGFALKINTVVTKDNLHDLENLYRDILFNKNIFWRLFELQHKGDFKDNFSVDYYYGKHVEQNEIIDLVEKMNSIYTDQHIFGGTKEDLKEVIMLEPSLDVCKSHPDYKQIANLRDLDFIKKFKASESENGLICGKY